MGHIYTRGGSAITILRATDGRHGPRSERTLLTWTVMSPVSSLRAFLCQFGTSPALGALYTTVKDLPWVCSLRTQYSLHLHSGSFSFAAVVVYLLLTHLRPCLVHTSGVSVGPEVPLEGRSKVEFWRECRSVPQRGHVLPERAQVISFLPVKLRDLLWTSWSLFCACLDLAIQKVLNVSERIFNGL